jgi:NAD(P)-dependent dehydrogenase (short-subunit alcohol dehydrogenase family)
VALGARRLERLEEVAREVDAAGGSGLALALDVTDAGSIERFVARAREALGPIDALVSNAGVGAPGLLHEVEDRDLRLELDTNLLGPLRLARCVLPAMRARRSGDLVFVTSQNAVLPRPFQVGYTASKAGLEGAVRALAMELEGSGVRASIVRPGPAPTEMGRGWDAELVRRMLETWKRWGALRHGGFLDPESVARAVVHVLTAPRGAHLGLIQVDPEAPVR